MAKKKITLKSKSKNKESDILKDILGEDFAMMLED